MKRRRHSAGRLSYAGDVSRDIVGQVMGPTTFGTMVVATSAVHDRDADRTFVEFDTCWPDDGVSRDEFGTLRLVELR